MVRSGVGTAAGLTGRQRDVLGLLAGGATDKETALALDVSVTSVRRHVADAQRRLSARTRSQAIAMAIERRLLPVSNLPGGRAGATQRAVSPANRGLLVPRTRGPRGRR